MISKHTFVGPVKCGLSQTFVVSPKNQLSPHLQVCGIRVVKHHVYVTRETRILYHVIKFPLYLSFTVNFSTPKSVVSCIFYPLELFLAVFIRSFSILRNSQLESDVITVCRIREV